ncbi:glycosyltransferase [Maribacter sp. 2-571]|uniref:glycosyltransferase n=1 Tax=Maribacter sp. 2-571 TaxID=3417569 RepID=UPI003D351835
MHYGIVAQGTRGDVQPMVALALELTKRGNLVTLVAPENFRIFVEGFHLPFVPLSGDIEAIARSPKALKLLKGGNIFRFFYHYNKATAEISEKANLEIYEACKHVDHIISGSMSTAIVYSICEKLRKKCAIVFLSMPSIPTRDFPLPLFNFSKIAFFNKLSYRFSYIFWLIIKKQTNDFRKKLQLPLFNVWEKYVTSNTLTFYTMSNALISKPTDWPSNVHITGIFKLPPKDREKHIMDEIPEGLEAWIANGTKPIYIGFGSIPIPDVKKFSTILFDLLNNTRERIIFGLGWSVLPNLPKHPNLFPVKYVNHDWLFPQCKLAINHGGHGSMGSVLRGQIPILILSILADQPYNGKLIEKNNVGLHIPFNKISAKKIRKAIKILQEPYYVENAKAVGSKINEENGVLDAAMKIEAYFNHQPEPSKTNSHT